MSADMPPADAGVPEAPGRELPSHPLLAGLAEQFPEVEFRVSLGQSVALVPPRLLRRVASAAKDSGFEVCVDVTAVDYLHRKPRFEVVVSLLSMEHGLRLRLLVGVSGSDPVVPSLVPVYPGANFFEREVYDMFGIGFEDHPDLTRILMPDDWEGHPLRKDYPVGAVPVQFKESHRVDRDE
ncbi:MAG: NADH-quinone oxidoreductase subunit C [Acidimicrobiia bacterium]